MSALQHEQNQKAQGTLPAGALGLRFAGDFFLAAGAAPSGSSAASAGAGAATAPWSWPCTSDATAAALALLLLARFFLGLGSGTSAEASGAGAALARFAAARFLALLGGDGLAAASSAAVLSALQNAIHEC